MSYMDYIKSLSNNTRNKYNKRHRLNIQNSLNNSWDYTYDQYCRMLDMLSPDLPWQDWTNVLISFKAATQGTGFTYFDVWSKQGRTYDRDYVRRSWEKFSVDGSVTAATLIRLAKDAGWNELPGDRSNDGNSCVSRTYEAVAKHRRIVEDSKKIFTAEVEAAALARWSDARPVTGKGHEYLIQKDVLSYGLRTDGVNNQILLVPVYDSLNLNWNENGTVQNWLDGEPPIMSLQQIFENGKKIMLRGGRTKAGCFVIGKLTPDAEICFCEGYATGATVYQVLHETAPRPAIMIICFSAGNLSAVAVALKNKLKDHPWTFYADNDEAGIKGASKAIADAERSNDPQTVICLPPFSPGDSGNDWNDYFTLLNEANKCHESNVICYNLSKEVL